MGEHVLVVVPTFNGSCFIRETIRSVQVQDHGNWTLVVADDRSTDDTRRIVASAADEDRRIHLVRLETNSGGPATPRNRAIDFALRAKIPFEYIAFLDDDDIWMANKLTRQLSLFRAYPEAGLVYSKRFFRLYGTRKTRVKRVEVRRLSGALLFASIPTSSVVLRRVYVEPYFPLFDEDPLLRAVEDFELWIRLLAHGLIARTCDEELFVYRVRAGSITERTIRGQLRRDRYLFSRIASKYPDVPKALVNVAMAGRMCKRTFDKLVFGPVRRLVGRVNED